MKRAELRVGERVRVCDGQPEPPKHHTKKHRSWAATNCEGTLAGFSGDRAQVETSRDSIMVMVKVVPIEWVQPIEVQP